MSSTKSSLINAVQQLVGQITNYRDDSKEFKNAFDKISPHLQGHNTVYVANKAEVDRIIESLSEKFAFHGFVRQKNDLLDLYRTLVPTDDRGRETMTKLSLVKLLIELSESPTNNFDDAWQKRPEQKEEEKIDWGRYLLEERWSPPPDEDSSESDDDASEASFDHVDKHDVVVNLVKDSGEVVHDEDVTVDVAKSVLSNSVQSYWFNAKKFVMKPASTTPTANLAILWNQHLDKVVKGLIPIEMPNIIDEHLVLREIVWQMHVQHSGASFQVIRDRVEPVGSVTISSMRLPAFQSFLTQFLPYMWCFHALRTFSKSLTFNSDYVVPNSYRSYDSAVGTITKPMFKVLVEIEEKIRKQETIYTLLVLANDLRPMLEPLLLLNDLNENVLVDFKTHSAVSCTTTLLSRLYRRLFDTKSKLEQDLYLTLYLQSLYQYLMIVNSWLGSGDLVDCLGEFVISTATTDQGEYVVKELDDVAKDDPILGLICTQVLQIGKNVHLLRRLGKIKHFFEYTDYRENFYDVFIDKVLENVAAFFDVTVEQHAEEDADDDDFAFPWLCPDDCKYYTEMDKLENLVDTSDGFLMKAFEPYFVKNPKKEEAKTETLYAKIQKLTKTLFPIHNIITSVFVEILDERYSKLGFLVKTILVRDYELNKHFEFLQNIFLFKDDMIFPFYRRLFDAMDSNQSLGNHAWLTSFLQDVIVDAHPSFCDMTSVELNHDWRLSAKDPLKACEIVNVKYRIEWPVNVIITVEQVQKYRELFQFILKIKWALYALNHLYFADLKPKKKPSKILLAITNKLKMLRFGLLNVFSSIQYYILGHVFSEFSVRFSKELENAYDLETLTKAHADFVSAIYSCCSDFQNYERDGHGVFTLLNLIGNLRYMWRNVSDVKYKELCACEKSYWTCHKNLDRIMNASRMVYDF